LLNKIRLSVCVWSVWSAAAVVVSSGASQLAIRRYPFVDVGDAECAVVAA
jgi:hypothetical protein